MKYARRQLRDWYEGWWVTSPVDDLLHRARLPWLCNLLGWASGSWY